MRSVRCAAVFAACTIVAAPRPVTAAGQDAGAVFAADEPARAAKEGKVLRAFRVTESPPLIDGHPDDEVWTRAQTASEFVQWDPDNGESMTEATVMQVAYDNRFLYVMIRCLDRTPAAISRGLGRRDEQLPTDYVAVGVDPRHDHQTGYTFFVNPSGVQRDMSFYDDDRTDTDYDAVWEVRTAVTAAGWLAEYRIPFSQMRFSASPQPGQVWGFSGRRSIRRRGENGEWTARPRGERGIVSRFGHLVFDAALAPPRRLELQPYLLGGVTQVADHGNDVTGSAGADLRVGLGTSATLSVTANPDFGQVEQDPAVLNLSVFETFFPEKRPFFLEDSRTFVPPYGLFQLFHSRRIGGRPDQFAIPDDTTTIDRSEGTTILGAVKLTGKARGWTYGALTAATAREFATIADESGDTASRREFLLEPRTSYNVVRVQRDFSGSNVGVIATGAVRERTADAYAGGVDYNLRWDRNRNSLSGHWAVTRAPIDGVPQTGFGGVMNGGMGRKYGGVNARFDYFDEHFRPDDLGFFRTRRNRVAFDVNGRLEQPDPWKAFRRITVFGFGGQATTNQGLRLGRFAGVNGSVQFLNYWTIEGGGERIFPAFDDLDTRGGPPIARPPATFMFAFVSTDNRKTWRINAGGHHRRDAAGGSETRLGPGLTLQPSTRLQTALEFNYETGLDDAQWIKNADVDDDGATDHIYGTLDRHVVDITLRTTFAIHRDMTVQLFLQPFVAAGDYRNSRRLSRPASYEFQPVMLDEDPDFSSKSLRGNVVLRWEYQRGSTMYVAWNLSGTDDTLAGRFSGLRDLRSAFGADGTHAVLVKFNYWLSR